MARPTNKEKEERKILLKYFKRDSELYTTFEKRTEKLNKEQIKKIFLDEASHRSVCIRFNDVKGEVNNYKFTKEEKEHFKKLENFSKIKYNYYSALICSSQVQLEYLGVEFRFSSFDIMGNSITTGIPNIYNTTFMIDEVRLIEMFGKDRVIEMGGQGFPHDLKHLCAFLTDKEKEILRKNIDKNPLGTRTTILKYDRGYSNKHHDTSDVNSFLVEIDFSQPLEEIQKQVELIYSHYQTKELLNVYDFLNIEYTPTNQNEIYKTNSHKPFNVVLADKLFIYDSIKMGLNKADVQKELIDYHSTMKDKYLDKITSKTIKEYLDFMIDLIDNGGLHKFQSGFTSK